MSNQKASLKIKGNVNWLLIISEENIQELLNLCWPEVRIHSKTPILSPVGTILPRQSSSASLNLEGP